MDQSVTEHPVAREPATLRLDGFRRSLRDRERRAFDRVFDRARKRASLDLDPPAGEPSELLFLSVLIEQELSIMRMEAAVEEICWTVLGHGAQDPGKGSPAPRRRAG